jgi:hypothetical protein
MDLVVRIDSAFERSGVSGDKADHMINGVLSSRPGGPAAEDGIPISVPA